MSAPSSVLRQSDSEQSLGKTITQLLVYYRLVIKNKWPILITTFALTLIFTVIIGKWPNVYQATATILVDPQQIPEKYVNVAVGSDRYAQLDTITQQVLTSARLQQIIEKYDLYQEFRKSASPQEAIEAMRQDITTQEINQDSRPLNTFALAYQGKEPKVVAAVANELADSFVQWNIDSRKQEVSGTRDFLSSELQEAKQNLEQQEGALRQFKMSHLGETPDQTETNLQVLANLRSSLQANAEAMDRADEERILLERFPEQGDTAPLNLTKRARLELEKRQLEVTLEQLRNRYSDLYPDVVKATHRLDEINAQLESLPADPTGNPEASSSDVRLQLIDKDMKKLKAEQDRIQSQIEAYQAKVNATPIREQQLVELTRNYDMSKQHYQSLLDKSFDINMATDLEQKQKAEQFKILEQAQVPDKPIKPKRKLLIPVGALAAFGFSLFCILTRKVLSPAIQTESELKSIVPANVRVIAQIPHLDFPSDARRRWRWAICAFGVCAVLCLALIEVLWKIRPLL